MSTTETTSSQEKRTLRIFLTRGLAAILWAAIFAAGAGRYPNYSQCAFTVVGEGQFLPGAAAQPHIGQPGALETV